MQISLHVHNPGAPPHRLGGPDSPSVVAAASGRLLLGLLCLLSRRAFDSLFSALTALLVKLS
jgi:hypothetical protein